MNKRVFNVLRKVASGINSEVGGVPASQTDGATFKSPGRFIDDGMNRYLEGLDMLALRKQYGDSYVRYLPIFDYTNPEGAKRAFRELKTQNPPMSVIDNMSRGRAIVKPENPGEHFYGPAIFKDTNNR